MLAFIRKLFSLNVDGAITFATKALKHLEVVVAQEEKRVAEAVAAAARHNTAIATSQAEIDRARKLQAKLGDLIDV